MGKKKLIIFAAVLICLILAAVSSVKIVQAGKIKGNINLGNKYLSEGNYQEAILAFEKVINIDPKNLEVRVGLAKSYIGLKKYSEAESILKSGLIIIPDKPELYIELANLYMEMDRPLDAISCLNEGYGKIKAEKIKTALEDIKSKLVIGDLKTTLIAGNGFVLPKSIKAKVGDAEAEFTVKWDNEAVDTSKPGSYVYNGRLPNIDKEVKLVLNVIGIASIENINAEVKRGESYKLPEKVKAIMTDNTSMEVNITWNSSQADTSKEGNFNFQGSVEGYVGKVSLTLKVIYVYDGAEKIPKQVDVSVLKQAFKLYGRDIVKLYGNPASIDPFIGAYYYYYAKDNITFAFLNPSVADNNNSKFASVSFRKGYSVLGVKSGMSIAQAGKILGVKLNANFNDGEGDYMATCTKSGYAFRFYLEDDASTIIAIEVLAD